MKALLLIMMIELCTALAAGMHVIYRQNNKMFSWELAFLPAMELPVLLLFLVQFGAFRISSEVASESVQLFVFILAFLAMNAAVFLLVNQSKNEVAERKMAEAKHQAELEHMHYERVRECRQELSEIQNEYDAMLAQVSSLIGGNQTDMAGRLLKDLSVKIDSTREEPFCQIAAVNAILTAKKKECDREGITLDADLLLPGGLPVKDLDLCMALGNLVDNAIRECKKAPGKRYEEPQISLSGKAVQGYLVLRCTNPVYSAEQPEPEGTGLGLKILKDMAKRYQGDFFVKRTGESFLAQMSLPLAAEWRLKC